MPQTNRYTHRIERKEKYVKYPVFYRVNLVCIQVYIAHLSGHDRCHTGDLAHLLLAPFHSNGPTIHSNQSNDYIHSKPL